MTEDVDKYYRQMEYNYKEAQDRAEKQTASLKRGVERAGRVRRRKKGEENPKGDRANQGMGGEDGQEEKLSKRPPNGRKSTSTSRSPPSTASQSVLVPRTRVFVATVGNPKSLTSATS